MSVRLQLVNTRVLRADVEPAARDVSVAGDVSALVTLLHRARSGAAPDDTIGDVRREGCTISNEEIDEEIAILRGDEFYSVTGTPPPTPAAKTSRRDLESFVRDIVVPDLVVCLCLEWAKVNPDQDMTHTPLMEYLYERSTWIEGIFTFRIGIQGGEFVPSPGESSERLSPGEVARFSAELASMSPPGDSELRREYDNLRALVTLAHDDSDLALLVTIL